MAGDSGCVDANEAVDFADGRLSNEQVARVEEHLSGCGTCRELIADLATGEAPVGGGNTVTGQAQADGGHTVFAGLGASLSPVRTEDADLKRGTEVGRYVVVEPLGRGGMGIVYRAHDPELARSVALKVMRVAPDEDDRATRARARLLREARALAQVQHPNVIAVHDVGTIDDDVFIAMELADGKPLGAWLQAAERTVDEIVDVFEAAGRGLEAAHDAGLVHRDFKPDNVMVGDDGRVRVLDFGLVRDVEPPQSKLALATTLPPATGDQSNEVLTRAGWVIGTPAYMAPEQHTGGHTDPRTDQFSFCVALYEALFDQRPFGGESPRQRAKEVVAGRVRPPPATADVPDRLRDLVLRGLSRKPADRYPTMDALLEDLRPHEARKSPNLAFLAAGVVLVAGVVAVAFAMPRASSGDSTVCKGAPAALDPSWGATQRTALTAAFTATDRAYAASTAQRVVDTLDAYAASWVSMHTETCEATHVHGTQSDALLDLRMTCLDQRRIELAALVAALTESADGSTVDQAVQTLSNLEPVDSCANAEALQRLVPLPADPEERAAIAALEGELATAKALYSVGRYPAGLELARALEARARAVEHAPTHARALFILGRLQNKSQDLPGAEKVLREATTVAARAKADELTARAWIELIWVVAYQNRLDEALNLRVSAESALARAGDPPLLEAAMLHNLASVMLVKGDHDGAEQAFEEALRLRQEVLGPLHPDVGATWQNIATLRRVQGDYPAADAAIKRALAAFTESLGPDHPSVASSMFVLGRIHHDGNDWDRALSAYQASLDLRVAALGEDHPLVAASSEGVAAAMSAKGDHAGARRRLQQALDIKKARLGDEHPHVAGTLATLGDVLIRAGDYEAAVNVHREALRVRIAAMGESHGQVGYSRHRLGEALEHLGEVKEAREQFEQALVIFDRTGNKLSIGAANYALARLAIANDPAGARQYADKARDAFVAAGDIGTSELEKLDAWLAEH